MSDAMKLLRRWSGLWVGEIETDKGEVLKSRMTIAPTMECRGSVVHAELTDPATGKLSRGLRMMFAVGPDQQMQTVTFSTQLGLFGLEQTPDDEDVIALTGVTDNGVQLNVTYREEDPDTMMLTVFWRPHGTSLPRDATPGLSGRLYRREPWRPEKP
ncbi:MAG: hypothetical protein ICCCNLDF_02619 [Planctomycetes bacterium]|nr:hypothetical protein [Planctomycetota bacterium]